MSKLYVGNLPSDVNEGTLRQLFQDHGLSCSSVLVKRGGYAFVDCPDQGIADRAIDKLNGYNFLGSPLVVEPSVGSAAKKGDTRVRLTNVPGHVEYDELETFLSGWGRLKGCEKHPSRDGMQIVQATYETPEQAQQVVMQLNDYEYEGSNLKAEVINRQRPRLTRPGMNFSGIMGQQRQTDFPLRVLVLSDMVGAIIGRQGNTIRQITQSSRARVDVHRKDNAGSLEKAITVYGNPENCSAACSKILEVMQEEANKNNKGEIPLKLLAHNNLIGRIIGKGGNVIKKIMEDTDTKITVSSINDINSFNLERIITIKGDISNISKAESIISSKLRASYENDLQALAPQAVMFPGLHPMAMMSTVGLNFPRNQGFGIYGPGPTNYPPIYPTPAPPQQGPSQETSYLYIPNSAVGAIIGTKGSHIRSIIRFSGASVKIAALSQDQPADQQTERKVTISGTPEAQWKAQFMIFEKMREEGYVSGNEDVRLTVEVLVPSSQVGRIIGKGGQNVRELQRSTGAIIKLPQQGSYPSVDDTTVQLIGPFYSVQSAQRRILSMVNTPLSPVGGRGRGRRPEQ